MYINYLNQLSINHILFILIVFSLIISLLYNYISLYNFQKKNKKDLFFIIIFICILIFIVIDLLSESFEPSFSEPFESLPSLGKQDLAEVIHPSFFSYEKK